MLNINKVILKLLAIIIQFIMTLILLWYIINNSIYISGVSSPHLPYFQLYSLSMRNMVPILINAFPYLINTPVCNQHHGLPHFLPKQISFNHTNPTVWAGTLPTWLHYNLISIWQPTVGSPSSWMPSSTFSSSNIPHQLPLQREDFLTELGLVDTVPGQPSTNDHILLIQLVIWL